MLVVMILGLRVRLLEWIPGWEALEESVVCGLKLMTSEGVLRIDISTSVVQYVDPEMLSSPMMTRNEYTDSLKLDDMLISVALIKVEVG